MFKTRKEFLRKLLIGIYNTERINCESNQIYIEGKSLFDKCDFTKINKWILYKEGFVKLFETTFINPNVLFRIDTNGGSCKPDKPKRGQIQFTKKNAISNAYSYLNTLGVNFAMFGGSDFLKIEKVEIIILEILYMILDSVFNSNIAINCDEDISSEIIKLKSDIEFFLCGKAFDVANTIHTTDSNSVIDSKSKKEECNHFISVGIQDLGIPYAVKIVTSSAVAWIMKKKEKAQSYGEYKLEDYLMSEIGVYDPEKDIVFDKIPFCNNEINETYEYLQSEIFNISHICPDCRQVNEFVVYYLFNFNAGKLKVFYPDIETLYELRRAIIARGKKELYIIFEKKLREYYSDVMKYIEDVLDKIMSINLEKLITGDIDEKIVSRFNINYDYIIKFLKNNGVIEEKGTYLYLMIERALSDYTLQIDVNADNLARNIVENMDAAKVEKHASKINDFISSDELKKAILIQGKDEKEHPEKYTDICDDVPSEQKRIDVYTKRKKGSLKKLIYVLDKYYCFLQWYQKNK